MKIDGFEQTGKADGDVECVGALDRDGRRLRKGRNVWWRQTSYETDEWEPYCRACALAYSKQTW